MKPLIVGENPSHDVATSEPLAPGPGSGGRLMRILGVSARRYRKLFDRTNLCGGAWDRAVARQEAERLLAEDFRDRYVLLGRKVADAFGLGKCCALSVVRHEHTLFVLLPHPSGRCRVWNDRTNVLRARRLVRDIGLV